MSNELSNELTFTNPRTQAEFNDWPSGSVRVTCRFWIERDAKRGYRVCRQTQNKDGVWCKPKRRTFGGHAVIVDGSDGKTYTLQIANMHHNFVIVGSSDLMDACDAVFSEHTRHVELTALVEQGQPTDSEDGRTNYQIEQEGESS